MLKVENICKTYDDKIVLNNLSFTVPEGEIFTLVGAFGEGKSTLINIIAGFEKPDSGNVFIKGTDCQLSVDKARTLFGYVPDKFPGYNNMTLKEYMNFFGVIMDSLDREQIKHLTVNLLGFVGLEDYIDKKVRKLDYGQKQKLSIARALLHNPKFLILDEPFYGLNVDQVVEIKDILEFLHKQGRTIFMTSDNLQLSASLSTSVGIIENGEMLYGKRTKAAYDNIVANSRQVFTKQKYSEEANATKRPNMGTTRKIPKVNATQMPDLGMTSNIPYVDVTQTPDLGMTSNIPYVDVTQMPDLGMTSNIPYVNTSQMSDLGMTGSIPYVDELNIPSMSTYMPEEDLVSNLMVEDEPIRMPYEEIQNIERTRNGENISRRVMSKQIDNPVQENKSFYDSRRVVSKRGIEEKRGVGGSRVVTDKNKYNNRSK